MCYPNPQQIGLNGTLSSIFGNSTPLRGAMSTTMSFSPKQWRALRKSGRGFLYIICKGSQRQRKVGVCALPCAIAVGLTQRWICNVRVDAAYLWRHIRYTLLYISHHSFRFDRSGIEPRNLRSTETEASFLLIVPILILVQHATVVYKGYHGV